MKVSIDSRTLSPGDIFIPVKGERFDGNQFIEEAIAKGASKIVREDIGAFARKYRRKLSCRVIAVTGSYGKTTVKDMLYYVLRQKYRVSRTLGNQNNQIGVPLTVLRVDADTEILILECAMRQKGEIAHLAKIVRPTDVVLTGVGYTHAHFFKSVRGIAAAKSEIFRMPLRWESDERHAYISLDTRCFQQIAQVAKHKGYTLFPYQAETGPNQNIALCYLLGRQFGLSDS